MIFLGFYAQRSVSLDALYGTIQRCKFHQCNGELKLTISAVITGDKCEVKIITLQGSSNWAMSMCIDISQQPCNRLWSKDRMNGIRSFSEHINSYK